VPKEKADAQKTAGAGDNRDANALIRQVLDHGSDIACL
jgi:hypothetical protein